MPRLRAPTERQARPSSCVACKKAATGYNYGAPSCYSCKTFFRRTILQEKLYLTCPKSGVCKGDESLRPCRTCRFEKCVSGGMNPLIMGSLENPQFNPVVLKFFKKYLANDEGPLTSSSSISDSSPPELSKTSSPQSVSTTLCHPDTPPRRETRLVRNPAQLECKVEKMMQDLIVIDAAHHTLRVSTYSPRILPETTIDEFVAGTSKLGFEFKPMFAEAYEPISIQLVPEEFFIKHRIVIDIPHDFDYAKKKLWIAQDILYTIEFLKALPIYNLLNEISKRVLLSSAVTCCNFTSAFYSYTQRSDRTCYPDGGTMSWSREIQEQSPDSTRFHTGLIAAMREAQLDRRECTLLKMIAACNPMLEGLSPFDATLLRHERERCTKMLVFYVLARIGVKEGPIRITQLLAIVDTANKLTSWQKSQQILMMAMGLHKTRCAFAEAIFHSS